MKQKNKENKNELTVSQHLRELKHRALIYIFAIIIAFLICYARSVAITNLFIEIGQNAGFTMGFISPQELLIQSLRLCGTFAVILTMPIAVYQIMAFLSPVFNSRKAMLLMTVIGGIAALLFALGILFCFKILFPFVFKYLCEYTASFSVSGIISVSAFLDFLLGICWILAAIFEMPLLTAVLSFIGILSPSIMLKTLRPALIVILILSAIVTPPDVISMFMVAVPITCIYMISILVSWACKGGKH